MEVKNPKSKEASPAKKNSLKISEDDLKTAKERIFRLKKKAKKENDKDTSLNGKTIKKKVIRRPVVYVGHLPHGFYEEELRGFFTQFGQVCRVKVSRSKKTGNSKGYAFVEFTDDDVARIAAETMNNYLMFERLLKAKYIPAQRVHPDMFPPRWITPESYPALERRNRVLKKQEEKPTDDEVKKHKGKVLKSLTRSLAVLHDLGISDYLPLVYDPPRDATKDAELKSSTEACVPSNTEDNATDSSLEPAKAEVELATSTDNAAEQIIKTPASKKVAKSKTPARPTETVSSESVNPATPKVQKLNSVKTPAKASGPAPTEIASVKTPAKASGPAPAEVASVKTPARSPKALVKSPSKTPKENSSETVQTTLSQNTKTDIAKTPAKANARPAESSSVTTPISKASQVKTPGKKMGSDSLETTKMTPVSKATPAKSPGKPVNAVKTPVSTAVANQSPKPTPAKTPKKLTSAKTPTKVAEPCALPVDEAPAKIDDQVTEAPVAKRALAKSGVSTPSKTPKKAATPKPGKTPKKTVPNGNAAEVSENAVGKMDVENTTEAVAVNAKKDESTVLSEVATPAKTPTKTPSKLTPKAINNGTPKAAVVSAAEKSTPGKTSPRKRPAESEESVSPTKVAVRTPVSVLKSPAGRIVVTPLSAEKGDVVMTPKSPAITPPARRLTRAAAKRMSLKISPKMDVVFSPRLTRRVAGTPSTPAGRRKSVKP